MKIFFPKELDSETRVSITPDFLKKYLDSGLKVSIETGMGLHLGFKDEIYKGLGAEIVDRNKGLKEGNIICSVNKLSGEDLVDIQENSLIVSFLDPFNNKNLVEDIKAKKISSIMTLIITIMSKASIVHTCYYTRFRCFSHYFTYFRC